MFHILSRLYRLYRKYLSRNVYLHSCYGIDTLVTVRIICYGTDLLY